ncbi:nucleotidyltransferase family protein [Catenovulum sp. 2E275]|uniref:nucleotidyltransferase family protein n=1 Tax=Catenovulum sp. 2E275 TaxID=2980497 RepID=UPI0021CFA1C9|nr:nucleotidyltransferase family protein [Catenovulum sp. 2E275]MCU4674081.1 nucleotidyltransferase family protein [Catenovulum sp. 2E275]
MKIAGLIMAAGQSSRFNACKQLAKINDQTLLDLAIHKLKSTQVDAIYLVTGYWHHLIYQALGQPSQQQQNKDNLYIVHNPNWQQGLGNSIAFAVTELKQHYDAILITLADQVAISADEYNQLINQFKQTQPQPDIVCAKYQNKRGVPAIFGQNLFPQLTELNSNQGAKKMLYQNNLTLIEIMLTNAATDIDTQADLASWQHIQTKK